MDRRCVFLISLPGGISNQVVLEVIAAKIVRSLAEPLPRRHLEGRGNGGAS